jgi:hypothetical protein
VRTGTETLLLWGAPLSTKKEIKSSLLFFPLFFLSSSPLLPFSSGNGEGNGRGEEGREKKYYLFFYA